MENILRKWFRSKLSGARIKSRLARIKPADNVRGKIGGTARAACVQRCVKPVRNVGEYIDMLDGFVRQAAEQGCDIIAFPEYNFFDLFGIIPGFTSLNNCLNRRTAKSGNNGANSGSRMLYIIFRAVSEPVQYAIEAIMCGLAQKYRIYIYTGSYFIRENGSLYNGGALISREGKILGRQKKLHLTDFEDRMGIKRDTAFKVFPLDIGKTACPVCMDATYFETFNLARSLGCDIVILPIANNEEYRLFRALRGIWPRVQESHVYGIKAALTGWFCGFHFTGKAGIFAPINLTSKGDGVVSVSKHFEGDSLVMGDMDIKGLYRERSEDEYYGDSNPEFEKYYFYKTYGLKNRQ